MFVLYIEHDNAPHDVSVHKNFAAAEAALIEFCNDFYNKLDEMMPSDKDLVETLEKHNKYIRMYETTDDWADGIELTPFERTPKKVAEAAAAWRRWRQRRQREAAR
jgi:hypothetical protein